MIFIFLNVLAIFIVSLIASIDQWAKFCLDKNWGMIIYMSGILFPAVNITALVITAVNWR